MVVNLIIAVICDAVHVLGNENKAGLYGYDSDGSLVSKYTKPYPPDQVQGAPSFQSPAQRLEELQKQLDEMVMVQEQMMRTIEVLTSTLTLSNDLVDEVSHSEGDSY